MLFRIYCPNSQIQIGTQYSAKQVQRKTFRGVFSSKYDASMQIDSFALWVNFPFIFICSGVTMPYNVCPMVQDSFMPLKVIFYTGKSFLSLCPLFTWRHVVSLSSLPSRTVQVLCIFQKFFPFFPRYVKILLNRTIYTSSK